MLAVAKTLLSFRIQLCVWQCSDRWGIAFQGILIVTYLNKKDDSSKCKGRMHWYL